jgi:hypothetical protein
VLPGPKTILLSGFSEEDIDAITRLFTNIIKELSFVYLTREMLNLTLQEVLSAEQPEEIPLNEKEVPRVMIFSGISMESLHTVLDKLRESHIQRPIIATTTEHNLTFTVKELLMHLLEEMKELSKNNA